MLFKPPNFAPPLRAIQASYLYDRSRLMKRKGLCCVLL
ncbi:hypothetical protein HHE06_04440 [Helicobacter heilmannii]|nr:hypothetical protein HHE06_04440 [Helicobacter heilmannii]